MAFFAPVPARVVAFIMSFGSGVLISALSFELMEEAYGQGGLVPSAAGFLGGAVVYTLANVWLARRGAKHRKRSGDQQPSDAASGQAIALGALLDGVPESVAIGVSMLGGGLVSMTAVVAIFLSNIPEGLSSASGMKKAGRSATYIFGLWTGIAVISGVAALLGYIVVGKLGSSVVAGDRCGRRRGHSVDGRRHDDPGGVRGQRQLRRSGHRDRLPDRLQPVPSWEQPRKGRQPRTRTGRGAAQVSADYSTGTKMQWRIFPSTAFDRWPLPLVSSTRITSPAPMIRASPSLAVICTPASRLMMYCRRGAGCQSRS